jgi:hypothetical protein
VIQAKPTPESAGLHLRRAFGFGNAKTSTLFYCSMFRNDVPEDYLAGFLWHPHRGIETITFSNASDPLAVPTEAIKWADTTPPLEADNRSLILFDRGDEVTAAGGE